MTNTRFAFIGGGAMGDAIIRALLGSAGVLPGQISVSEPDAVRRDALRERYSVNTFTRNADCAASADVVLLAVKPQIMGAVLADIKPAITSDTLIFSIAAGVTIGAIRAGLHPDQPVIRTMPNTPAQIAEGMTGWLPTANVSETQIVAAKQILAAMGAEIQVASEPYLDMVTGVSGSGPAFVFLLIEAMVDAAVHMGFMRPVAEKLVLQTFKGSIDYALQSPMHLAQLRNQVTSAGGTTAAGLYELERHGVRTAVADAVWAAYRRSVELGK
jgi:pyrroline-5-carboxylate reductase